MNTGTTKAQNHLVSRQIPSVVDLVDEPLDSAASKKISQYERQSAFEKELPKWNKGGAYTSVASRTVAKNAIIVDSHVVNKRNLNGSVKTRIVTWGHRDQDKDFLGGDATSVSLKVFHLLLSLAAEHKWTVGKMDIETAFLQVVGFNR